MKNISVPISSIVGSGICVSTADGHRVFDEISKVIEAGDRVVLSFSGITRLTTAFLNAAVGQLYGVFTEEHIRMHLAPVADAEPWQLTRLKLVVDRAKIFFSRPEAISSATSGVLGFENDEDI